MFHRESPDEESAKEDPEHASRANTWDLETCPEETDTQQRSRPKLTAWKMNVGRLSDMERYRKAGRRNGVSGKSRALAAALRKTEVGILQSVEEVWFAGCHCDVGGQHPTFDHKLVSLILSISSTGGTVPDVCRHSLADIPLRWMVKQVVLSQCGVLFDDAALRRADIEISTIFPTDAYQPTVGDVWNKRSQISKSPTTSGREDANGHSGHDAAEEFPADRDVLADCHDELKLRKGWWMLEMLPMKYAWQEANGKWKAKWG